MKVLKSVKRVLKKKKIRTPIGEKSVSELYKDMDNKENENEQKHTRQRDY